MDSQLLYEIDLFNKFCRNVHANDSLEINLIDDLIKTIQRMDISKLQDGYMDILKTLSQNNMSLQFAYDYIVLANSRDKRISLIKYYSKKYHKEELESLRSLFPEYAGSTSRLKLI